MRASMMQSSKKILQQAIIISIWLCIWQLLYVYIGKAVLVPSPFSTFQTLMDMVVEPEFYLHILFTLYRVIIGVGISFGVAFVTSIVAYFIPWVRAFLKPLIIALKSTPVMAVIILALLWFSSSNVPIFTCFLMCYPVVYTNIITGFDHVERQLLEMAQVFQVPRREVLKSIYLPHAKPYILSAITLSIGLAFKVIIAAEVLAVPQYSMGYNLLNAKVFLETEELFAWVVIVILLSSLCEKLATKFLLKRGGPRSDQSKKSV